MMGKTIHNFLGRLLLYQARLDGTVLKVLKSQTKAKRSVFGLMPRIVNEAFYIQYKG